MSTTLTLHAELRSTQGKEAAAKLRQNGKIPAVIYGAHKDACSVTLDLHEFDKIRALAHGEQILIDVQISDGRQEKAFIREVQREPVTQKVTHADLLRVNLDEEITMKVPLIGIGTPIGVTRDKGILEQVLREMTVRCLPGKLPPHIEVSVTDLAAGHSLHIGDLPKMDGVLFMDDPKAAVFAVVVARVEEEPVAEAAATEPEVIKAKKEKPE